MVMMRFMGLGDDGPPGVRFCDLDPETAAIWRLPLRVPVRAEDVGTESEVSMSAVAEGIRMLLAAQPAHPDAAALRRFLQKYDRHLWDAADEARTKGDWRGMVRALELMTAIDPEDARALCDLAFAYRRAAPSQPAFLDLAATAYRQAMALAPELSAAQTGYGALLLERGEAEEAIPFLEHSLQVRVEQASALYYLGRAYGATGQDARAREYLERAMALAPSDPRPPYYLAVACSAMGDRAGAIAAVDRALALDPSSPEAQYLRAALEMAEEGPASS